MTQLLEVDGLTRHFGGVIAVSELTFAVAEGEMVGVIGPNGAGKSTLFGLVSGGIQPTSGRLRFAGADVAGWSADRAARAGIGRTYQIVRAFRSMKGSAGAR
jgi:branched-chain amino acid transport system ATP-binding protein